MLPKPSSLFSEPGLHDTKEGQDPHEEYLKDEETPSALVSVRMDLGRTGRHLYRHSELCETEHNYFSTLLLTEQGRGGGIP